jgi:hypothetical protein
MFLDLNNIKGSFRKVRLISCVYEPLRHLDVQIWWFLYWRTTDDRHTNRLLYPLLCMRACRVIMWLFTTRALYRAHSRRAASAPCCGPIWRDRKMRAAAVCLLTTFTFIEYVKWWAWAEAHAGAVDTCVANKIQFLRHSWTLSNDSKHNEASFTTTSTDSLRLRVAQTPRSRDLAILVSTEDR